MAYRDPRVALRARQARLEAELDELRAGRGPVADVAREIARLEAELARQKTRKLPMLEDVRVATPCGVSWDTMTGDDRVRFCGQCKKNVYNLSAMGRAEAEALVAEREGPMCVRLSRRADGTVLSGDCPVGVRRRRVRIAAFSAVGGSLVALGAALGISRFFTREKPPVVHVAGEMTIQGDMAE
jgi:hypothetical protein